MEEEVRQAVAQGQGDAASTARALRDEMAKALAAAAAESEQALAQAGREAAAQLAAAEAAAAVRLAEALERAQREREASEDRCAAVPGSEGRARPTPPAHAAGAL